MNKTVSYQKSGKLDWETTEFKLATIVTNNGALHQNPACQKVRAGAAIDIHHAAGFAHMAFADQDERLCDRSCSVKAELVFDSVRQR